MYINILQSLAPLLQPQFVLLQYKNKLHYYNIAPSTDSEPIKMQVLKASTGLQYLARAVIALWHARMINQRM